MRSRAWQPETWQPDAVPTYAATAKALWRKDDPAEDVDAHYDLGVYEKELYAAEPPLAEDPPLPDGLARGRARGRRQARADHQPRPGVLPGARRDQARPGRVLPLGLRRHRQRAARAAVHAAPLPQGGRRRQGAPEAAAVRRPRRGWRRCGCTSHGGTAPPTSSASPRSPRWCGRCRCRRSSSTRGTAGPSTWRSPTSGGSTSTRGRTAPGSACSGWHTWPTRCSTTSGLPAGRRPRAAPGCTSTCGSRPTTASPDVRRAALAFAREVERRAPSEGHDDLVAQGPRSRAPVRRLQPERPRPHHRRGVLRARQRDRHRLRPDPLDRGRRVPSRRLHHRHHARALRRHRRPARRHRRPRSSTSRPCWSGPIVTRPPARRPLPSPTPSSP